MAEILIELSGKGGLGNNFAGDTDQITTTPNLRIDTGEGEMAQGLFNPYLREGYLAPISTTTTNLTRDIVPSDILMSSEIDLVNGYTFFGEHGRYIYIGDNSSDTTLNQQIDVGVGNVLNDLDIYEINSSRKLFYLYTKPEQIIEASLDYRGDWTSIIARVDPAAGAVLQKVAEVEYTATFSGTSSSEEFTVPAGSNLYAIVFVSVETATSTTVNVGGAAATLIDSWTRNFNGKLFTFYTFYKSVSAGAQDVDITHASGSGYTSMHCIVYSGAAAVPVTVTDYRYMDSYYVINKISTNSGSKYLQYIFADNSTWDVANITVGSTFNPGAQTGNNGYSVAFSTDGTKMYVDGVPAATTFIYQYTLSTAWDVTTAVYATLSKDIDAQINDIVNGMSFSPDGTKLIMRANGFTSSDAIKKWDLSTAWNISTATYDSGADYTLNVTGLDSYQGVTMSQDGLQMYVIGYTTVITNGKYICQFTLGTAWDPSTATFVGKFNIPEICLNITLSDNDSQISVLSNVGEDVYQYNFDPLFPFDITKIQIAETTSQQIVVLPSNVNGITYQYNGGKLFARNNVNDDVLTYNITTNSTPAITTTSTPLLESISSSGHTTTVEFDTKNTVEIGYSDLVTNMSEATEITGDLEWLTGTKSTYITTSSDYNFLRKADNGFLYAFTQNKVSKIDGGVTGGLTGFVTKNVLLFPEYFSITDAVDYRSQFYIAVHHYPVTTSTTSLKTHTGKCGIVVWNRISSQLNGIDFIELPGVKEIKRIYASPDGVLKLITISDNGSTQLRQFGYNDSGGVVFPIVREMGIGAFPQFPDGLTTGGDKVLWLANDGKLYCEKEGVVTQLFQVKDAGTISATTVENIISGAVLYSSGDETGSTGFRSNKQGIVLNYREQLDALAISSFTSSANQNQDVYSGGTQGRGQSFTVTQDCVLSSATFQLSKFSTPTGNADVAIYAHSGTFGSTGIPATAYGSPLAVSDSFDVSTLTGTEATTTFTFTGANQILLTAGTSYVVVFRYYTGGSFASYVRVYHDTAGTHPGNGVSLTSGFAWGSTSTDIEFSISAVSAPYFYSQKVYPFDLKTGSNAVQTPHQGDVYTGVQYIPVTSVIRQVRIYNAPITGTGSSTIATVKLYFNQSSTVSMTKTVTKDEAKRGYIDFHINKPYLHAIQIEVEWATDVTLDGDIYLPSVAVISHDPTTTKSPDNG